MFDKLFNILLEVEKKSLSFDEGWGYIKISGKYHAELCSRFVEVENIITQIGHGNTLSILIDGGRIDINEVNDIANYNDWSMNINKKEFEIKNVYYHFFLSKNFFFEWSKNINLFTQECQINKYEKLKIIVCDIEHYFGGPNFLVGSNISNEFGECLLKLPTERDISQIVHCVSETSILIKPQNHIITFSKANDRYVEPFLKNACIVLVASIVNEFYSPKKIILRGIRRIQLSIIDDSTNNVNLNLVTKLSEVVSWIYEDKTETRQKLFIDRLSLDINYDIPLINELSRIIDSAFQQAKERYNFVIIDRKENYLKEVRDLLKDMKIQSDLYSGKIRNLLSNLLRDVLAGFLLIGFSLFTKVSELNKLVKEEIFLEIVFKGLAIYFIFSAIIQAIIDITDMIISKREMFYWKNVSREFIPEQEFNKHIKTSLKSRILSVWILYALIVLCYFGIAYLSYKFPYIWGKYLLKMVE
jgi:hypothetical protein